MKTVQIHFRIGNGRKYFTEYPSKDEDVDAVAASEAFAKFAQTLEEKKFILCNVLEHKLDGPKVFVTFLNKELVDHFSIVQVVRGNPKAPPAPGATVPPVEGAADKPAEPAKSE